MLDKLKKYFTAEAVNPVAESQEEAQQQEEVMSDVTQNASEELVAQLTAKENELATLQASYSELADQLEKVKQELASYAEMKAAKEQAEALAKAAKRKESLEAAVGTEKAATLLSSLEVLDDTTFQSVVSEMASKLDKESSTSFKETGVTAEVEKAEASTVQKLASALAEKYQSK